MKKYALELTLLLLTAVSAFSQTELFEQDMSGIHAYTGLKWNSKITQPVLGFEYTIESRATFGIQAGMPLKDTLFSSPDSDSRVSGNFHSYFFNPYFMFEFLEPDNLSNLSFSVRGDYIFEGAPSDSYLNGFSRQNLGLGPVFALRLHSGDKMEIIPQASYEFFYVKSNRNWVTHVNAPGDTGIFSNASYLQHDFALATTVLYRLDEAQGLTFEPKVVFKAGGGLRSSDLLNIDFRVGYLTSF